MKRFKYKVKDSNGKTVKGVMESKSPNRVVEVLQGKGYVVVDVKEEGWDFSSFTEINVGGVPIKDKVLFMRQFATMISAGLPLNKCLEILSLQVNNPLFRKVIQQVLADVEGGSSLAGAFKKHEGVFDDIIIGLLSAAEASGNLEEVLLRLADELEDKKRLQDKIKSAFTYPIVIVLVMIVIVFMLMVILVPAMVDIYGDFDAELPWVTRALIIISEGIINYWYVIIVVLGVSVIGLKTYLDTSSGRRSFDLFVLKLPIFGNLITKIQLMQWTKTLSLLLNSGLSIVESLKLTSDSLSNVHYRDATMGLKDEVEKGLPLAVPLARDEFFPTIVSQMVAVGEESGSLDGILKKMAQLYSDEVDNIAKNLATLLEPFILVIMGGIIGFIAMAVYMPMFSLAEAMF